MGHRSAREQERRENAVGDSITARITEEGLVGAEEPGVGPGP